MTFASSLLFPALSVVQRWKPRLTKRPKTNNNEKHWSTSAQGQLENRKQSVLGAGKSWSNHIQPSKMATDAKFIQYVVAFVVPMRQPRNSGYGRTWTNWRTWIRNEKKSTRLGGTHTHQTTGHLIQIVALHTECNSKYHREPVPYPSVAIPNCPSSDTEDNFERLTFRR